MSLNTAECKAAIVHFLKVSGTQSADQLNPDNWKRDSKKGNKDAGFIRVFSNKKDSSLKVIIESSEDSITGIFFDGQTKAPTVTPAAAIPVKHRVPAGTFLYCIMRDPDFEDGDPGLPYHININTVACWKKEKCLADHYSKQEWGILTPVLDELGLEESMESTYTYNETEIKSLTELVNQLEAHGFERDTEFNKFMWVCDGNFEDDEKLPWWDTRKISFEIQVDDPDFLVTKNKAAIGCATECSVFLSFKDNPDYDQHMRNLCPMLQELLEKHDLDECSECTFDYLGSKSPEELKAALEAEGWEGEITC